MRQGWSVVVVAALAVTGLVLPTSGEDGNKGGAKKAGAGKAASHTTGQPDVADLWEITAVDVATNTVTGIRAGSTRTLTVNNLTAIKVNNAKAKLEDVKVGMEAVFVVSLDTNVAAQVVAQDAGTAAKAAEAAEKRKKPIGTKGGERKKKGDG